MFIAGLPIPQPRPRFSTIGGHARAYTPKSHPVMKWRETLLWQVRRYWGFPAGVPVSLAVQFYLPRPESHTKAQRKCHLHLVKPDIDNLLKPVMDALVEGECLHDDGQVYIVMAAKYYEDAHPTGLGCGVDVSLMTVQEF